MYNILELLALAVKPHHFLLALGCLLFIFLIYVRYRNALRFLPGPFWASILPFDRLLTVARGHRFATEIKYHRKYGPIVRVGPNHVSFSDTNALAHVYSIGTKFQKSDFYMLFDARTSSGDVPTVFSIRSEVGHRALRRPVANAFSLTILLELEPLTDECIRIMERKLLGLQGRDIDLGEWLHWYAFDVVTSITFSNRLGFMEQEKDVGGVIEAIEGRLMYNSTIGQTPQLHKFLLGNNLIGRLANFVPALAKMNTARYIVQFAAAQLDRYKRKDQSKIEYRDMLDRFRRFSDGKEVMSDQELLSHASTNIFAGSDTTAISLRSMFYYFCKNPRCYKKLVAEIDTMDAQGQLSDPITFAESNTMPYLQACMKEAMRLHPAVGLMLERVVPAEGATIAGKWLPPGTVVGANPWVVARDQTIYGDDAESFRPERWIEADGEKLKAMEKNHLAFGAGTRTCLGKNISLLEMSKLVPQLLRRFNVELSKPDAEWTLADYWFVKQTNLICRLTRRTRSEF